MPYSAEISRTNPTALVFLLDQSGSMLEPFGAQPEKSKAEGVADALNRLLQNLVLKCAKADGVRDFFHVGMLSYGGRVRSAFGGALAGSSLVPVSTLANNPLRVEVRKRQVDDGAGGLVEQQFKFPVWFESRPTGQTPMREALLQARECLRAFLATQLALKLIDYDGMFVPALARTPSGECGHASYQHPQRQRDGIYNVEVDRFPLLLVATALTALKAKGQALWEKYDNGDNILFKEEDLQAPTKSPLFADLLRSGDPATVALIDEMLKALKGGLASVRLLDEVTPEAKPAPARAPAPRATPVKVTASASTTDPWAEELSPIVSRPTMSGSGRGVPLAVWLGGIAGLVLLAGVAVGAYVLLGEGGRDTPSAGRSGAEKPTLPNTEPVKATSVVARSSDKVEGTKRDDPPTTKTDTISTETVRPDPTPPEKPEKPTNSASNPAVVRPPQPPAEDSWRSLFNGKDIKGWKVNFNRGQWRVKDGIITVNKWSSLIASPRDDYENFRIRIEAKVNVEGTGNIFLRWRDETTASRYMVRIDASGKGPRTGSLFRLGPNQRGARIASLVEEASESLVRPDEWFTLETSVIGDRVVVWVNDKTVVETRLQSTDLGKGHLGIGYSAGTLNIRKIEVKELPGSQEAVNPPVAVAKPPDNPPPPPPAPIKPGEKPRDEKGFVPLFNGKDTKGWKTHPSQRGNWRVKDDILIGSGPTASHLYTVRDDYYRDFHLRVEARINDGGNSGVYFRTAFGPRRPANNPQFPLGYEAQIACEGADVNQTGSLYVGGVGALFSVFKSPALPDRWFTMEMIVEGNRIKVKVAGKTVTEYTDSKHRFTSGHIGLQQHDGKTVVEFRKIEIEELPAAKP